MILHLSCQYTLVGCNHIFFTYICIFSPVYTVNDQKFPTLHSIPFWSNFGFSNSCFLKYMVELQTVAPDQTAPFGAV